METFIAVYRGPTISSAKFVAASADPDLVRDVATRLLRSVPAGDDPVVTAIEVGRRRALRLIKREARDGER